ncbi:type II toxin-antitoxin system toxin DNA ADP-ribosyl transferase DarT [Fibrella aquatilis]|uniref:DUF4433 domain-containing protein n=1 Tax=Fibrella aquatilis TaxID=2817059 RepID=A0A939K0L9_9BACT|nr:DUF4433 domain-containing protein [Fibrella aquatilis]MBO0934329.1 DUF4433 domain-containing protein [Fibrella aquatilis]
MDLHKVFLYRMMHIENIAHVFVHGLTHRNSTHRNPVFIPIGDGQLIGKRADYLLSDQTRLGDYTPFYFGPRMPMLYVIQHGFSGVTAVSPEKIVYCISSVGDVTACESVSFLFTDGHAFNGLSSCFTADRINEVNQLIDWKAIRSKYWQDENDLDLKRRMEAEFLLMGDLPASAIRGYVVYNLAAATTLVELGIAPEKVIVKPEYYF